MTTKEAIYGYLQHVKKVSLQKIIDHCRSNRIEGPLRALKELKSEGKVVLIEERPLTVMIVPD